MTLQRDPNTRIVILGAGIVGCTIADKLTELGMKKVNVLEQGPLFHTGGSSSHAPGLVFQTNGSKSMMQAAMHSVKKFSALEHQDGLTYFPVGGVEVAVTAERMNELKRRYGFALSNGHQGVKLLSPDEVVALSPLVNKDFIVGGYYIPQDGIAKAVRIMEALAKRAQSRGAVFQGDSEVLDIEVKNDAVRTVVTAKGNFEADIVVCAAGIWGPKVGKMVGISIPLQPLEHQLVHMKPLRILEPLKHVSLETQHPILRHQDRSLYFKQLQDTYVIGSYQHRAIPVKAEAIKSWPEARKNGLKRNEPSIHAFTPKDFEKPLRDTHELLPALTECDIDWAMNGMFSFTQDGMSIFGESSRVKGFWSAEAVWVTHSGGFGDALAEWIALGRPVSLDLREHHIARFEKHSESPTYIRERGSQNFIEVYDIIHPRQPMNEPRPLRVSPFYIQQKDLGAFFLESSGWERPQWFEANKHLSTHHVPKRDAWSSQFYSPIEGAEHKATREGVAVFDMTSLKKAEVSGKNAQKLLDNLTTGNMSMGVGRVTYTLMLDETGGIKSDVTVARIAPSLYHLGLNNNMDIAYLKENAEAMGDVHVEDTTSKYCCVGVWGPQARALIQSVSEDDWSEEGFGFFKVKESFLKQFPVRALRLSYVGELGWELYTPYEYGYALWNVLWQAGHAYDLIAAGRGALGSLRIEKGYRAWGSDMWSEHSPEEAGLGFAVRHDKADFIGKEALARREIKQRLRTLSFDNANQMVQGSIESVFKEDEVVGYVTSACYGYTVGKGLAYAWLEPGIAIGDKLSVLYFGEKLAATVEPDTLYDPTMTKMRATNLMKSEKVKSS
jgi:glycine cleavage system aminomethyltransferase T/glycine/D-amino acid oxidase-like deaminating enzyme